MTFSRFCIWASYSNWAISRLFSANEASEALLYISVTFSARCNNLKK